MQITSDAGYAVSARLAPVDVIVPLSESRRVGPCQVDRPGSLCRCRGCWPPSSLGITLRNDDIDAVTMRFVPRDRPTSHRYVRADGKLHQMVSSRLPRTRG
jgi:hypothetical protein